MQWLLRIVCIAYFIFLTLLLLTKDPARLIGAQGGLPWILQALLPVAHTISFSLLAFLALITRWPAPRWAIVIALAVYGGMTEIVQGYVPGRTPDWADWLQDLAGTALGAMCCWGAAALAGALAGRRRSQQQPQTEPAVDCAVTRKLL